MLLDISYKNIERNIRLFLRTGKVKPLYCAIGDINLLLAQFDAGDLMLNKDPWSYGDYNDPYNTLHYISDRFNAPNRLQWLKYGIEHKLFKNYIVE